MSWPIYERLFEFPLQVCRSMIEYVATDPITYSHFESVLISDWRRSMNLLGIYARDEIHPDVE